MTDNVNDEELPLSKQLSICIPTFNRAKFLSELLDSIILEIESLPDDIDRNAVEIVISDNASKDGTDEVINQYRRMGLDIKYIKQSVNIGADRNYIATLEASTGRFCWLMGSDDRIEHGGLSHVMTGTKNFTGAAGFTIGVKGYDSNFKHEIPISDSVNLKKEMVITGTERAYEMFIEQFGFISAQIVRRELWKNVCSIYDFRPYLNAYVHLFIIGQMLVICPKWGFNPKVCVGWRSGNDSFFDNNWLKRMQLDIVGYSSATEGVFGKGRIYHRVADRIARTHIYRHYIFAKSHDASRESLKEANSLLWRFYGNTSGYWMKLLPIVIMPTFVARLMRIVYRCGRSAVTRARGGE